MDDEKKFVLPIDLSRHRASNGVQRFSPFGRGRRADQIPIPLLAKRLFTLLLPVETWRFPFEKHVIETDVALKIDTRFPQGDNMRAYRLNFRAGDFIPGSGSKSPKQTPCPSSTNHALEVCEN